MANEEYAKRVKEYEANRTYANLWRVVSLEYKADRAKREAASAAN